jgi:Tropinone reductase 1
LGRPGALHGAADVATEEGRAVLVEAVSTRWDSLHVLVNNVGMNIRKGFADYEEDEYRRVFETNLFSAMALSRSLLPFLQASGRGSIINVASVAGTVDVRSGAPYGMTKAALVQMTRHLAVEWAPLGIRVNAVSPWYTRTPLAQPVLQQPERLGLILAATPLGRIAEAEEVGAAIAFLAMDKASYISGHDLVVDGAFLAKGL